MQGKPFCAARAISCAAVAGVIGLCSSAVRADDTQVTGNKYHYQVVDHYCASASIQMILDCTAVRSTNAFVNNMLNAPQTFASWPVGNPFPPPQPTYGGAPSNALTNPQVAIYNNIHGQASATFTPVNGPFTGVPLLYNNPFTPFPTAGSDNNAIAFSLNQFDNPNFGGEGTHAYTALNFASGIPIPNLAAADAASRTIVNAIHDYDVPAQATVGHGAHSIVVEGYTTIGVPGRNQPYTITGLYVSDPWTGYAAAEKLQGRIVPGGKGLGVNAWLRYGYHGTNNPFAPIVQVPGVGLVRAVPNAWFQNFNPAPAQGGTPANATYGATNMAFAGYKCVIEPLGPELPDDLGGGVLDSFPDFALPLVNPVDTAVEALSMAGTDLGTADFNDEFGLSSGGFDANLANITLMDPGNESDWLVPYMRNGEYSGAVLIDSETGIIEQAMWLDNLDDFDFTLGDIQQMYTDIYAGVTPNDNTLPEPGTGLLVAGAAMLLGIRRRR